MKISTSFDYFFDLPGELREQILGLLLVKKGGIILAAHRSSLAKGLDDVSSEESDYDGYDDTSEDSPTWPLNYFLVSQVFNREATAIYFSENNFHISATGRKYSPHPLLDDPRATYAIGQRLHQHGLGPPPPPGEALLNTPEWERSRRRIRKVVLDVQRPRGSLSVDVFDPLLDMILAGGLKVLEVRIVWFATRGERVLDSAPMRSLYRVLSDPDLDIARLRVPADRHEGFWCDFHGGGGGAGCGRARLKDEGLGSGWFDIDIGAVVKAHGGEEEQMRIFEVGD